MTKKENTIAVIAQQFYGDRTGTMIDRDHVNNFLCGDLMNRDDDKDVKSVVRKIIRVPGSENIVIVYDQTQEDRYVNITFPELYAEEGAKYLERWGKELKMHVSCEIPEIGFKIHTRCFACRMDDSGVLQSLEENDYKQFIHFFS